MRDEKSRIKEKGSGYRPAQPEPGAGDDEGHLEERDRLETTANGGGGTDENTVTNSHSSSRAREERGKGGEWRQGQIGGSRSPESGMTDEISRS